MRNEILISSDPWENRVAILEDGEVAELYIEREEKVIGSIFKGKVHNVLPGMGAAFVDIGLGRNAFLYVDDINKQPLNIGDVEITQGHSGFTIGEKVKRNDEILVQIVKEPRGLKGARISTNISLPGRYLILMPTGKYSGVSRKIESATERDRLKKVMQRIRPEGMATVVRTAAAGVSDAELMADLGVLIRMWHGILEVFKRAAAPSLLHKDMNLVFKAARDFVTADVDRVMIDNEDEYRKVREFLQLLGPQYLDRIEHYNGGRSLFHDFGIDTEIERLMKPKINLASGGSIVIETTEALTVIDVNSGKFTGGKNLEDTITKINVEAAGEIARQVRLRDIGGIIVVDFIDMGSETARNKVLKALEDGLRRDRTRATIQSFSNLGLLEFTRKRVGKDLAGQLRGSCPTCIGLGTVMSPQSVAIETLRQLRSHTHDEKRTHAVVDAAPSVAAQLDFWYDDECEQLAKNIGVTVHVRAEAAIHPERTRIAFHDRAPESAAHVRVGDEVEVGLLPGRLPNPNSAAALVGNRIVEVENAANHAGNAAKIRILDVDDAGNFVVAEMISAGSAVVADDSSKRRRPARSKTRRGAPSAAEQTAQLKELAAEAASAAQARPPIGITTITEEEEAADAQLAAEVKGEHSVAAIVIGEAGDTTTPAEGDRHSRHRRRRRGRRGRGGSGPAAESASTQSSVNAAAPQAAFDEGDDDELQPTSIPPIGGVGAAAGAPAAEGGRRRRRRRGRRGRGGAGVIGNGPMPDRSLFRVGSDGAAESTGRTLPPEPSRAIKPYGAPTPPAVEPPPPHLRAQIDEPKPTKPVRARRPRVSGIPAEIASTPRRALPAPEPEAAAPKKRTTRSAAAKDATAVKKAPAKKATAKKATATKATATKATATKAATGTAKAPVKKTATKKSPAASGAKKATTTRKKRS
ncbi:MAG TPA: Rne/Rng family ribonuclease [Candidatus Dormibacteraeota bacterium]|nr:Rne/Rng family ribonuclease [Candidatus Dormibacteraeota bacterium]